jgi:hypothetical protein
MAANDRLSNKKFYGAAAFVVVMAIALIVALLFAKHQGTNKAVMLSPGTTYTTRPANLQPKLQKVQQPPTARQVADQLDGTNFTQLSTKGGTPLVLEAANFYIGDKKYAVDTFLNKANRDAWLPTAEMLGVVPYWVTPNAVVYPSTDS